MKALDFQELHLKSEPEAYTEVSHLWKWSSLSPRGIQVGRHQGALQRRPNMDVDEYLTIAASNISLSSTHLLLFPVCALGKLNSGFDYTLTVVENQNICLITVWAE